MDKLYWCDTEKSITMNLQNNVNEIVEKEMLKIAALVDWYFILCMRLFGSNIIKVTNGVGKFFQESLLAELRREFLKLNPREEVEVKKLMSDGKLDKAVALMHSVLSKHLLNTSIADVV